MSSSSSLRRREFVIQSITSAALTLPFIAVADEGGDVVIIDPAMQMPKITLKVYLDVEFAKSSSSRSSRLVIGLFGVTCPRLCKILFHCVTMTISRITWERHSIEHCRVIPSKPALLATLRSGKAGITSFTGGLPSGLVSAVRSNTNGEIDSRFFIQTEDDAGWADDRYAAFGIVLDDNSSSNADANDDGVKNKGMDLVRRISRVEVKTQNSPKEPITIVRCGVL